MINRTLLFAVAAAAMFTGKTTLAETLDFGALPTDVIEYGARSVELENAFVTYAGLGDDSSGELRMDSLVAKEHPGSFCGYSFTSLSCTGDVEIEFKQSMTDIVFDTYAVSTRDKVLISAFDDAENLLGTFELTSNGGPYDQNVVSVDLSELGAIRRLRFDDQGSLDGGVAYGNFDFTAPATTAVPLPGGLALGASGAGALALVRQLRSA